jgi:tRNA pseudouridine55 synthase
MYSALKVNGKKLCNLARKGEIIERESRPVTIHALDVSPAALPSDYKLTVRCSGGTYIRTLCADIGSALGCGGVMASLERTETGGFSLEACYTTDGLQDMTYEERVACLLPVETLFADWEAVNLPSFYYRLCHNGCEIYQSRIGTRFPVGTRLRLCDEEGHFFATGEVLDCPEVNATAIKATRLFVL